MGSCCYKSHIEALYTLNSPAVVSCNLRGPPLQILNRRLGIQQEMLTFTEDIQSNAPVGVSRRMARELQRRDDDGFGRGPTRTKNPGLRRLRDRCHRGDPRLRASLLSTFASFPSGLNEFRAAFQNGFYSTELSFRAVGAAKRRPVSARGLGAEFLSGSM